MVEGVKKVLAMRRAKQLSMKSRKNALMVQKKKSAVEKVVEGVKKGEEQGKRRRRFRRL